VGIDAGRWGTVQAERRIGTDGTAENVVGPRAGSGMMWAGQLKILRPRWVVYGLGILWQARGGRTALPYPGEEKLI
jgi:hypothetical protein